MFSRFLAGIMNERSRPKVAKAAGITNAYLGNLMTGARHPSREVTVRLAQAIGLPACELLVEAGYELQGCMLLIRGLPGSGKSTIARALMRTLAPGVAHYEADMYHMVNGKYCFDLSKIWESHQWCREGAMAALRLDRKVIVSNTFTQLWEMDPYTTMAKQFNVPFEVIEARGDYGNTHDVPPAVIENMRERWEDLNMEEDGQKRS